MGVWRCQLITLFFPSGSELEGIEEARLKLKYQFYQRKARVGRCFGRKTS